MLPTLGDTSNFFVKSQRLDGDGLDTISLLSRQRLHFYKYRYSVQRRVRLAISPLDWYAQGEKFVNVARHFCVPKTRTCPSPPARKDFSDLMDYLAIAFEQNFGGHILCTRLLFFPFFLRKRQSELPVSTGSHSHRSSSDCSQPHYSEPPKSLFLELALF